MSIQNQIDRIEQNVKNTYAVLSAFGADLPVEQNSDNLAQTAGTSKVVLYSEQNLNDAQKTQARENIGAQPSGNYALTSDIPTKVSELTNDKNYLTSVPSEYVTETELNAKKYLTSYTETDPTVPSWAKAANKPSYKSAEIGVTSNPWASNEPSEAGDHATVQTLFELTHAHFYNMSVEIDILRNGKADMKRTINGKSLANDITLNASDVGALSADSLPGAVNTALAQAKASGEFDGKSPVKGVDYFTDEEKDAMLKQLLSEFIVTSASAPSETSAIWIDTDDEYDDGFSEAVNSALRQAKESGEFDGEPYVLTDTDKSAIVSAVISALPVYTGEVV